MTLVALSLTVVSLLAPPLPPAVTAPERIDGMAFAPYYEFPDASFASMIDALATTGATHVSVVVSWSQQDVRASKIAPHPTETQQDAVVRRIIRRAKGHRLKVLLFPILWVEERAVGQWRGTLAPDDPDRWWRGYRRFVMHYAKLAAAEQVELFSVGSELASMEPKLARWQGLIREVRAAYRGTLLYSANWDHYEKVPFWGDVDLVGLTGYYRLTESQTPTQHELDAAWRGIRNTLVKWQGTVGKPLLFTELGYPSSVGAARSPWDYTGDRTLDLEAQRRCFEAFYAAWAEEPTLRGVFFWNWWGPGKGTDTWYTIRGKPAEAVVRRWYGRGKK